MKKLLLLVSVLFLLFACNKDKFQTTPQIKIKSISSDIIPNGGSLVVTLTFTDKEGDVDDSVFVKKIRLNKTVVPTIRDSVKYKIPDFPSHMKGDMEITMDYQTILSAINPPNIPGSNPPRAQPDTLIVQFAVTDKAKHRSDSVSTGQIIVIR
ncbi:MAG TPA: hypothetical protein VLD19_07805 [Chitinophagaceae bacterium]|nr:hypothetical protein [Chitinophagaceae bacterium]